jgi:hypothetical protein
VLGFDGASDPADDGAAAGAEGESLELGDDLGSAAASEPFDPESEVGAGSRLSADFPEPPFRLSVL